MEALIISHGFQDHYTASFSNGLAKNGVNVTLTRSIHLNEKNLDPRIKSIDLGQNTGKETSKLIKATNFLKYHMGLIFLCLKHRNSVVHIIGLLRFEILTGIIEGLFIRLVNRKFLLTVHNLLPHDNNNPYLKYVYYIIYRIPHLLMVHTAKMKEELIKDFSIRADKIIIIEHGVNDISFNNDTPRNEIREKLAIKEDDFVLLFFGRIWPYKGLDILLDAFSALGNPSFKLLVVGAPMSAEYGSTIKGWISNNKHSSSIISRIGWVEDTDIPIFFQAADLLVMPYRHIDQSGVLFLGFSFGLPVLSTNVGSMKDYLEENKTGVIVEGFDPIVVATQIEKVFMARACYSRNYIKEFAQKFAWATVLKPLVKQYGLEDIN